MKQRQITRLIIERLLQASSSNNFNDLQIIMREAGLDDSRDAAEMQAEYLSQKGFIKSLAVQGGIDVSITIVGIEYLENLETAQESFPSSLTLTNSRTQM